MSVQTATQITATTVDGPIARLGPLARFKGHFSRRVPLFYRVLVANSAIIVLGAIAGTAITTEITRRASDRSLLPLIVLFAGIGIGLSLIVNVLVLRAAFRPMNDLVPLRVPSRKAILTHVPRFIRPATRKWRNLPTP
jgi:hypothetical protein